MQARLTSGQKKEVKSDFIPEGDPASNRTCQQLGSVVAMPVTPWG